MILTASRRWWAKNALYVYAIVLGLASGLMTYVLYFFGGRGSFWGITTGESKIGGLAWSYFIDPGIANTYYHQVFKLVNPLSDPTQMIVIGILLGGLLASLALGEFTIRHFPNSWMAVQALIGGFLLGYGARMALGCNIGNYLSAWSSAGVNAVAFTAGIIPGVWVGTLIVERFFLLKARPLRFTVIIPVWAQRFLLILALILVALLFYYGMGVAVKIWLVFGVVFGFIGYLSKICWATGFREITNPLYGGGRMLLATALAILLYTLSTWPLVASGAPVSLALAGGVGVLQVFLGGILFGAGMGVAGACIFSSEWRAASGSVYSMIVLFSTIFIGMPVLAYHYEFYVKTILQPLAGLSFYHLIGPLGVLVPLAYVLALIVLVRLRVGRFFP